MKQVVDLTALIQSQTHLGLYFSNKINKKWTMSAHIRDKILDALYNIGDMVAQPVPILPPEIADPQDTISVELCLHNTRAVPVRGQRATTL